MGNGAPPPGSPRKQEQHLYQSATPLDTRSQLLQPPLPHHDSMSAFQHMLPTIVASKQHQHQQSDMVLDNQPSGLWSSDDYDSMMRSILDATLPSDHFVDLEAPPSLASFSASYAGSFVSGSSDSGASPNSINDLIYGASNFPTPPDSDLGSNPRNLSFSMASQAGTAFSPDGSLDLSNPLIPNLTQAPTPPPPSRTTSPSRELHPLRPSACTPSSSRRPPSRPTTPTHNHGTQTSSRLPPQTTYTLRQCPSRITRPPQRPSSKCTTPPTPSSAPNVEQMPPTRILQWRTLLHQQLRARAPKLHCHNLTPIPLHARPKRQSQPRHHPSPNHRSK